MKKINKKKMLLAASMAGLLAITGTLVGASAVYAADIQCSGINACKGQGECGGKGNSCAGKNACKGQGWVKSDPAEACAEKGGKVLPVITPAPVVAS